MRAEIHNLKEIMQEFNKSVTTLKEDIMHLKVDKSEMVFKIKRLEDEYNNEKKFTQEEEKNKESEVTDKEVVFNCDNCKYFVSCEK